LAFNSFSFKASKIWGRDGTEALSEGSQVRLELTQTTAKSLKEIRSKPETVIDVGQLKEKYAYKSLGRRSAPRYSAHFEVVLMSSKKSFRTKTVNISATGALLTGLVPSELTREVFEVLFTAVDESGKKEYFLFHAKTVDGLLRSNRIHFIKSMGDSAKRLNHLIEQLTPIEV
jgi:hypothetical protein